MQVNDNPCCACYNPEVSELIYGIKYTINKLSQESAQRRSWGYSCDRQSEETINELFRYLRVLTRERASATVGSEECMDCDEFQDLAEKVRLLTLTCDMDSRLDITVYSSGEDAWIAANPMCVSLERWEALAKKVACALEIEVSYEEVDPSCKIDVISIKDTCTLTLELVRNLIPCDVVLALYAQRRACELGLTISRTSEECELDFTILKNETSCNLTLKDYKHLVKECNFSFDIIKTIVVNGCGISASEPVQLIGAMGAYDVEQFQFTGTPSVEYLNELGVDTSNSEYLKGADAFMDKLNQDYSG